MSVYFGRKVRVELGRAGERGVAWEGLRVSFRVEKTATREPDTAEVQIYNLSPSSRSLAEGEGLTLRVFGGYVTPALLFSGEVSTVEHESAIPDIATRITAEDGALAWTTRVQETFAGPIDALSIIRRLADEMGSPIVYLDPGLARVQYQAAYVASGPVRRVMTDLVTAVGGSWMIQDGGLVITRQGEAYTRTGPLISPRTGLVGRAEKTDDGVKVVSLMQPGLAPGALFRVDSEGARGWFRAVRVTHIGDSGWESPFYTEIEGVEP